MPGIIHPFLDYSRYGLTSARVKLFMTLLLDSPRCMFGIPNEPPPMMNRNIPPEDRFHEFGSWVSAYFQHGNISTQNPDVLSWVEPSTVHPATINNMTTEEKNQTLCTGKEAQYDLSFIISSLEQFGKAYRKVFFDDSVRTLFPGFKVSFLAGELSPASAISSYWLLGNDAKETGKPLNLRLIPDSNHFVSLS